MRRWHGYCSNPSCCGLCRAQRRPSHQRCSSNMLFRKGQNVVLLRWRDCNLVWKARVYRPARSRGRGPTCGLGRREEMRRDNLILYGRNSGAGSLFFLTCIAVRSRALLLSSFAISRSFSRNPIENGMWKHHSMLKILSRCYTPITNHKFLNANGIDTRSTSFCGCKMLSSESGKATAKARYNVPLEETEIEIKVKNSRFIGTGGYTPSVEAARFDCHRLHILSMINTSRRTFVSRVKAKYPDARHHCYAFAVGHGASVTHGMSDDGEPSGTAGAQSAHGSRETVARLPPACGVGLQGAAVRREWRVRWRA